MNWQNYPKTELHLHLEGAAPTDFVLQKARQKDIDLSKVVEDDHYKWNDFTAFLKTYEAVMQVLKTPQDFHDLTRAVLGVQRQNGVVYTEIFLGPILMCSNDPALWRDMLSSIEAACDETPDIETRLIAVAVRHFGVPSAQSTAAMVARNSSPRLTGFGMAGAEDHGSPKEFARAFDIAREAGFGLTCHAGEWCGVDPIRETINTLKVSRIGHGVRASQSTELLHELRDQNILCEVCPGSNIALGIYPDWQSHPITKMRDLGVPVSISTDDPPYFWTTMTNEYEKLAQIGWTKEDFAKTNRDAMNHAFCDEETRTKILNHWS